MKYFGTCIVAILVAIVSSCKEIGPNIDLSEPPITFKDTNYVSNTSASNQLKNVLLEDFTGVRCVNCPKGHDIVHRLEANFPGRAIGVSIHSGDFFNIPYTGEPDLNSAEGNSLDAYVGGITAWPSGCINRKKFIGESSLILPETKWESYFNEEKDVISKINMSLNIAALTDSTYKLSIKAQYNTEETEDNYLSIMLLESKIYQTQQMPAPVGLNANYEHNNVLRKMLTPYNGVRLNAALGVNRVFEKELLISNLPNEWNKNNMKVVVFIHRGGTDKTVLQVSEINL